VTTTSTKKTHLSRIPIDAIDEVLAGNFALALDGHPARDAWPIEKLDAALKRP
jgi:hypothetical protein